MQPDQIIRTRRKTIALIVTREGRLVVRAPLRATRAQIAQFLTAKADWIEARLSEVRAALVRTVHTYQPGERFLYLGREYPLALVDREQPALSQANGRFELAWNALPRAREVFVSWYRARGREVFAERVGMYAARMGLQPGAIKITGARTRWGSCNARGTLCFTWRLALAPLEVIDYVIVHELAHLRVRNHSREFWRLVGEYLPEFRQRIEWLGMHGIILNL